jgi:large subunit ribosomal protein L9
MDVILLKDVEQVGLRGDVVNVARGYMRNYLEPRGLAQPATPAILGELRKREEQRARHEARSVEQAQEIADTLTKTVLRFEVKAGTRGRLFGSVTPTDIVDELWRARRIRVDRRKIDLHETIKRIGRYEVPITIFEDVRVEVKTLVVPEGGELPSDDEIAAWEAEERAEAEAAAGITDEPTEAEAAVEAALAAEEAEAAAAGAEESDAEAEAGEAEAAAPEPTPDELVDAAWEAHESGAPATDAEPADEAEPGAAEPEAETKAEPEAEAAPEAEADDEPRA